MRYCSHVTTHNKIKIHVGVEMNTCMGGALYFLSSSHSSLTVTEHDIMPHSLCIVDFISRHLSRFPTLASFASQDCAE